jgi:TRAP-type mannitol/chloroaromatic compound transport system substrate-binding protein
MAIKEDVLKSLHTKSLSRGIMVTKESLDDPEVIRRSEKDYSTLEQEIEGELPPFKKVYNVVKSYYKSLPWK